MDTSRDLAPIFHKGDNFCDFLFAFLHTNPLLKRDHLKETICKNCQSLFSRKNDIKKIKTSSAYLLCRVFTQEGQDGPVSHT